VARRYYTPALANKSLPLVQAIARDVRDVAKEIERTFRAIHGAPMPEGRPPGNRRDLEDRLHELQQRFGELVAELDQLGIELKEPLQGLLDFRAKRDGRDVYLCWRLGEERVGHWHELEAGFRGRQPIETL
jgi:hypothetical protein